MREIYFCTSVRVEGPGYVPIHEEIATVTVLRHLSVVWVDDEMLRQPSTESYINTSGILLSLGF